MNEEQTYIIVNAEIRANAVEAVKHIEGEKKEAGVPLMEVDIKIYKKNRTKAQNRLYWKWVTTFADEFGYEKEEMHETFQLKFLELRRKKVSYMEVDDSGEPTGKKITTELVFPQSTTKLTTKEFTDYLHKLEMTAEAAQLHLERPAVMYDDAMGIK